MNNKSVFVIFALVDYLITIVTLAKLRLSFQCPSKTSRAKHIFKTQRSYADETDPNPNELVKPIPINTQQPQPSLCCREDNTICEFVFFVDL